MGRINAYGSRHAARSPNRPNDRLSAAEVYKYTESFCGQFYDACHLLDRQRPRCIYHQSGAARLRDLRRLEKQSRQARQLIELLLESPANSNVAANPIAA